MAEPGWPSNKKNSKILQRRKRIRKRNDNAPPSGIKVFALGDAKPKESKEKKK